MKKIILCISLLTVLVSCSGNDDEQPFTASSEDLVGTWNVTQLEAETSATFTNENQTQTFVERSVGKDFNATFTFTSNTLTTSGTYTQIWTRIENGITTTEEEVNDISDDPQTWSLNNGVFTITFDDDESSETINFDVITFTENTFKISVEINRSETDGSVSMVSTRKNTITLER